MQLKPPDLRVASCIQSRLWPCEHARWAKAVTRGGTLHRNTVVGVFRRLIYSLGVAHFEDKLRPWLYIAQIRANRSFLFAPLEFFQFAAAVDIVGIQLKGFLVVQDRKLFLALRHISLRQAVIDVP